MQVSKRTEVICWIVLWPGTCTGLCSSAVPISLQTEMDIKICSMSQAPMWKDVLFPGGGCFPLRARLSSRPKVVTQHWQGPLGAAFPAREMLKPQSPRIIQFQELIDL